MRMNLMKNENTKFGFLKCLKEELDLAGEIIALNNEDGSSEVEFRVNGVDLDFQKVMDVLMNNFEACVLDEAKKMVHDKYVPELLPDVDSEIYEMQYQLQSIKDNLEELLNKTQNKIDNGICNQLKS